MRNIRISLKPVVISLFLSLTISSFGLSAQEAELNASCLVEQHRVGEFVMTAEAVERAVNTICKDSSMTFTTAELDAITAPALNAAHFEAHQLLGGYASWAEDWFGPVWAYADSYDKVRYPERRFDENQNGTYDFEVGGNSRSLSKEDVDACVKKYSSCYEKFLALEYLINRLGAPIRSVKIGKVNEYFSRLDQEWTRFIKEARSQTFADIIATTYFYKKKDGFDDYLQGPPATQYFALHPSVIIENVSDALDGNQWEESIAIEVAGFNRWQGEKVCFGLPCGASVIVTYADRAEVTDSGWGLMFHLDNKYSFGVTKHGDDAGFFITIDLLKMFEDKKSQIDEYKSSLNK